jgi:hypothetical protein
VTASLALDPIDPLLPSQLPPRTEPARGERALCRAMVWLALCDLARRGDDAHRSAHASAHAWLASDDITWPYAFQNVCAMLDLDCAAVRAALAAVPADDPRDRRLLPAADEGSQRGVAVARADPFAPSAAAAAQVARREK